MKKTFQFCTPKATTKGRGHGCTDWKSSLRGSVAIDEVVAYMYPMKEDPFHWPNYFIDRRMVLVFCRSFRCIPSFQLLDVLGRSPKTIATSCRRAESFEMGIHTTNEPEASLVEAIARLEVIATNVTRDDLQPRDDLRPRGGRHGWLEVIPGNVTRDVTFPVPGMWSTALETRRPSPNGPGQKGRQGLRGLRLIPPCAPCSMKRNGCSALGGG